MNPFDYTDSDPHDDDFFDSLERILSYRNKNTSNNPEHDSETTTDEGDGVMWGKRKPKMIVLQYSQMQALGRVIVRAMTKYGDGQQPIPQGDDTTPTLNDEGVSSVSTEVTQQATSILRRSVSAYFSHFVTENETTGQARENILIMFNPPLAYNGTVVTFHFDRQASPTAADAIVRDDDNNNSTREGGTL